MVDTTPDIFEPSPEGSTDREKVADIHRRYDEMMLTWSQIHEQGREDDNFIGGKQWDDETIQRRKQEGRPYFTFNMLPAFVRQVKNKIRQDRPQVRIMPVEPNRGKRIKARSGRDYSITDVMQGMLRNAEHISRADHAYDTAVEHQVDHGFGFFGLANRYSPHDPFVQDLHIYRIKDSYQVLIDPNAQEADFSDMADAFIVSRLSNKAFEKKYPDKRPSSFGRTTSAIHGPIHEKNTIQIATYWWREWVDDEVVRLNDGRHAYWSEIEPVIDELEEVGIYIARGAEDEQMRRDVQRPVVKWRKLTGETFLGPENETPFENIPIFPVIGEEQMSNGRLHYVSAIRHAKDPQKSYNFHRTAAIESAALQPKVPWLVTDLQIDGFEREWEEANKTTKPYLAYRHIEGHPSPSRQMPPQLAVAEMTLAQQDAQDIQTVIGLHEASLGAESNERTGKAVLARQAQGSLSTYHFPSNLHRALEAMGRCFVQAAPKVFDTERTVRIRLDNTDEEDEVTINQMVYDDEKNKWFKINDLGLSRFDVVIETGPSYATQRQEAAESMLELIRVLPPEVLVPVAHLMVKSMAFPQADKIATMLRKLVPEQFKTREERQEDLPPGVVLNDQDQAVVEETGERFPPPSPAEEIALAEQQAEQQKHQATQAKAQADQAMAQAKIAEAQAKMAEAQRPPEQPGPDVEGLRGALTEALEQHINNPDAHKEAFREVLVEEMADLLPRLTQYINKGMQQTAPPAAKNA